MEKEPEIELSNIIIDLENLVSRLDAMKLGIPALHICRAIDYLKGDN